VSSRKFKVFLAYSADDWSCLKCGNINWARRSSCNVCNAKKFADDQRTGIFRGLLNYYRPPLANLSPSLVKLWYFSGL
jgi:hypothetical protein